jgi:hypothetical protein
MRALDPGPFPCFLFFSGKSETKSRPVSYSDIHNIHIFFKKDKTLHERIEQSIKTGGVQCKGEFLFH